MTAPNSFSELVANHLFSMTRLSWDLAGDSALARFHLGEITVEVSFDPHGEQDWFIGFDVTSGKNADIYAAFQIFNGVFQAVEEFIHVRQPERLIFSAKKPGLAEIYETYLRREKDHLELLGYALEELRRVPPYSEYVLRRL